MRIILAIILWSFSFVAYGGQENNEHAAAALYAASRNQWTDALLHAENSGNSALETLIRWQYALDNDSGASFDEISNFINQHPNWPEQKKLRLRAELAMQPNPPDDDDILTFFSHEPPITGIGKIAFAKSKEKHGESQPQLIREGWINGDFDEAYETQLLEAYRSLLTTKDHIARTDRLLWEEKTAAAKRMLDLVPAGQQKLFSARMALMQDKKNAVLLVSQLPAELKHDAGLMYERMRYRARKDDVNGVREMLLAAPSEVPYPEKWWKQRELQIRKAIDEHNITLAKKLLAHHGQVDGAELADALWLAGWIAMEFSHDPKLAYGYFYKMYEKVRFPVSLARAAYWAGYAAEKGGDKEASDSWYDTAGSYPTTFYGQMALFKRSGSEPLHIDTTTEISESERQRFDQTDLAQAIRMAASVDADLASRLITLSIESTKDKTQATLLAGLGLRLQKSYLSVRGAKKAMQQHGIVLLNEGFPTPNTPNNLPIERALTLAITRQESEFDPRAKSPAGALGMMQLLPSTAKETAKKIGELFEVSRLYEPEYNTVLGSHYLDRMIKNYDGSYVMAIAAYNAGPGNVAKWSTQFGTPGNDVQNAINWIEKIPFSETRNYVQRVLSNIQVYRYIEAEGNSPRLLIGEDLVR